MSVYGVAQSPPYVTNSYITAGERMSAMHIKIPEMLPFQVISFHSKNFSGGDKRDRTADLLNAMGSIVNINEYFWLKQSNMSNYIA